MALVAGAGRRCTYTVWSAASLASGPRFDHTTGEGHVPFNKGDYHDALRHKNNQVALLLVECFGGIASGGARLLRYTSPGAPPTRNAAATAPSTASSTHGATSRTTSRRSAWRRSTRTPRTSPTASSASSSAR